MELNFAVRQGRTTLAKMQFSGPLRVQRPFYPESAPAAALGRAGVSQPCHCCLLHPPGGLVSGDDLSLEVRLGQGSHALLTAPSASKLRMNRANLEEPLRRFITTSTRAWPRVTASLIMPVESAVTKSRSQSETKAGIGLKVSRL